MIMIVMVIMNFDLCITLDSEDKVLPRPGPHVDVRRRLLVKVSGIHDRPADRDHEQMIRMGIPVTLFRGHYECDYCLIDHKSGRLSSKCLSTVPDHAVTCLLISLIKCLKADKGLRVFYGSTQ